MPHAHLSPRAVVDSEWEGFGHVLTMSSVFWGNNTNGKRKFGECASLPNVEMKNSRRKRRERRGGTTKEMSEERKEPTKCRALTHLCSWK